MRMVLSLGLDTSGEDENCGVRCNNANVSVTNISRGFLEASREKRTMTEVFLVVGSFL